jgi:multidrug efflux pump subunit AcrA (membrane-fusion protein)
VVDGTVRLVSPAVDPASRLGRVRILLGNDPNLRIGTFARGEVTVARGSGLAVPRSAVQFSKSGPTVQVVVNDTIETRPVTLGLVEADTVEIRSGVAESTLVVAKSGTFLRNGDRVRPVVLPSTIADGR